MQKQTRTSAATSINAARLPAVYSRFQFAPGSVVIDYGCGRYTDHIREALPGVEYLPIDPYNQPATRNALTRYRIREIAAEAPDTRPAVYVICSNVLNVIDSDEALTAAADSLREITARTAGTCIVTVYEGNRTGTGRETGPDQWQRNQRLREYLPLFPAAVIRKNAITFTAD